MFIQQLYTQCLSEAAYYIESEGEAVIIDPLRDVEDYLKLSAERGATIKFIFETHFHADFVSGHLELQKQTGAPIIYGPQTQTQFPIHLAHDGESFSFGKLKIKALHTPGHTIESTCYLLYDEQDQPYAVFTGDTLFIGDVGRPDLSSGNLGSEELAGLLFDSLHQKLLPLPDEVLVYPAHGPGSSCGKNLGPETQGTIGMEKETNYALQAKDKETFIKVVTEGLDAPPSYFKENARINKEGYELLPDLKKKSMVALALKDFKARMEENEDILILDSRPSDSFGDGFVPGSISIGLDGRFAEWAAILIPPGTEILLVAEPGKEEESVTRLARVGLDSVSGYLEGGFETWLKSGEEPDMIISVESDELAMDLPHDPKLVVVDVRKENEFAEGHVENAVNIPLQSMSDLFSLALFEESDNLYIHCGSGYRSVIACSLFKKQGFHNIRNVSGGWEKIKADRVIPVRKETISLN